MPELEDVADLDGALHLERLAAFVASLPRLHQAQVRPMRNLDVPPDGNVAQMETIRVGAGRHLGCLAQALVRINRQLGNAHRAQAARMRAQRREYLLRLRRPEVTRAERADQLGLVQLIIAAQQDQHRLAVRDINECLDLPVRRDIVRRLAQRLDGHDARRRKLLHFGLRTSDFGPWPQRSSPFPHSPHTRTRRRTRPRSRPSPPAP